MEAWRAIVKLPGREEQTCALRPGSRLGRDPALNDCVLAHGSVSGEHAVVVEHDSRLHIRDLGSMNKTRVRNGPSLERGQEHPLAPGLVVLLGEVQVRFECEVPAAVAGDEAATAGRPDLDGTRLRQEVRAAARVERPTKAPAGEDELPTVQRVTGARSPDPAPASADSADTVLPPAPKSIAPPKPAVSPMPRKATPDPLAMPVAIAHPDPAPPQSVPARPPTAEDLAEEGGERTRPIDRDQDPSAARAFLNKARARLVLEDEAKPRVVEIKEPDFLVGRGASLADEEAGRGCHHDHGHVSKEHARIKLAGKRFRLQNLSQVNGTFVGTDRRQVEDHDLRSEDPLVFGVIRALFVTDLDQDGNAIPRRTHERAANLLLRDKKINRRQLERARGEAREKRLHVGETLILQRATDVQAWAEAYERAALMPDAKPMPWMLLGFALAALIAVVLWVVLGSG